MDGVDERPFPLRFQHIHSLHCKTDVHNDEVQDVGAMVPSVFLFRINRTKHAYWHVRYGALRAIVFAKFKVVLLPTSLPAPPKTLSLMAEESVSSVSLKMRLAKESSFFSWSSASVIEFARLLVLTEAAEELLLVSDALRFFPLGLLEAAEIEVKSGRG